MGERQSGCLDCRPTGRKTAQLQHHNMGLPVPGAGAESGCVRCVDIAISGGRRRVSVTVKQWVNCPLDLTKYNIKRFSTHYRRCPGSYFASHPGGSGILWLLVVGAPAIAVAILTRMFMQPRFDTPHVQNFFRQMAPLYGGLFSPDGTTIRDADQKSTCR